MLKMTDPKQTKPETIERTITLTREPHKFMGKYTIKDMLAVEYTLDLDEDCYSHRQKLSYVVNDVINDKSLILTNNLSSSGNFCFALRPGENITPEAFCKNLLINEYTQNAGLALTLKIKPKPGTIGKEEPEKLEKLLADVEVYLKAEFEKPRKPFSDAQLKVFTKKLLRFNLDNYFEKISQLVYRGFCLSVVSIVGSIFLPALPVLAMMLLGYSGLFMAGFKKYFEHKRAQHDVIKRLLEPNPNLAEEKEVNRYSQVLDELLNDRSKNTVFKSDIEARKQKIETTEYAIGVGKEVEAARHKGMLTGWFAFAKACVKPSAYDLGYYAGEAFEHDRLAKPKKA